MRSLMRSAITPGVCDVVCARTHYQPSEAEVDAVDRAFA